MVNSPLIRPYLYGGVALGGGYLRFPWTNFESFNPWSQVSWLSNLSRPAVKWWVTIPPKACCRSCRCRLPEEKPEKVGWPSLKRTANAPENRPFDAPKGKAWSFQPSIFRGKLLVSGRVVFFWVEGMNMKPRSRLGLYILKETSWWWYWIVTLSTFFNVMCMLALFSW